MLKSILIGIGLSFFAAGASAQESHYESHYQQVWCDDQGGEIEHILPDRTRIDCLLDRYAVEVDFQYKWAEAIGQSLYYATMTHREPAVLLIVDKNAARYLARFHNAADGLGIRLFIIEK